jgi:hypothetical protein
LYFILGSSLLGCREFHWNGGIGGHLTDVSRYLVVCEPFFTLFLVCDSALPEAKLAMPFRLNTISIYGYWQSDKDILWDLRC